MQYRVLARKYRPQNFTDMVGQEAMVRTLGNAIAANRIAHAFILTGVRGIGKTTTARILAKALNCVGSDNTLDSPTITPCGVCENCLSIMEDRHVDVLEMDAASRTGVDDIRELIESVRYRPASARYKVYIIDEVHMLSRNAFNALLKTLEEPPPHVKFIFATTDIHKVPVTVLSRCQRFDLPRVHTEQLSKHLLNIAAKENITLEEDAAILLAKVAEGSVRDSLSLLDQAIALAGEEAINKQTIENMLGLASKADVFQLLEHLLSGNIAEALEAFTALYARTASPLFILKDLLEITHSITRLKVAPHTITMAGITELEKTEGTRLAEKLSIPILSRTWQALLKGYEEVKNSDYPLQATEMVLIRLCYLKDVPPLEELLKAGKTAATAAPNNAPQRSVSAGESSRPSSPTPALRLATSNSGGGITATALAPDAREVTREEEPENLLPNPHTFSEVIALFEKNLEARLSYHLQHDVEPISCKSGHLEIHLLPTAPADLSTRLAKCLSDWCGKRWMISVAKQRGAPSVAAIKQQTKQAEETLVRQDETIKAVLEHFPDATIEKIEKI